MPKPKVRGDLTDRQREILAYIHSSIAENGYPPTLREIGAHFGIRSTNGVNDHLKALVKKGFLERGDKMSRALVPTEKAQDLLAPGLAGRSAGRSTGRGAGRGAGRSAGRGDVIPALMPQTQMVAVPVLGRVAAGEPILAEENVSDTVQVDSFLLGGTSKRVFALRVTGESMINDGIFDGDYIFVKKQLNAEKGEIVVAMIEGEATVKRFYPEGDRIRFQPANDAMEPIYVHKSEFRNTQILGVVVGVYRRM